MGCSARARVAATRYVHMARALSAVELFAGCGGSAVGLRSVGVEVVALFDSDPRAVATLHANGFSGAVCADVNSVDFRPFCGSVDIVSGGPPCQPFSVGGLHKGAADRRNGWEAAVRAVAEIAPALFLFENAAGFAGKSHSAYRESIEQQFRALGYTTRALVTDAQFHSVPQSRRRCLFLGFRDHAAAARFVEPGSITPPPQLRAVLADLGPPLNECDSDWPRQHTLHAGAKPYRGHTPSSLDAAAKTIVAGVHGVPGGANCVRLDDGSIRYLTIREALRVQGFPDDFHFPDSLSWSATFRQIGNAAPPALIGRHAAQMLTAASL